MKQTGITCSITSAGGPYLSIDVHNSSDSDASVTQLDAYADIVYQKSTGIVLGGSGGNVLSEELVFVHDRNLAQRHANLLSDYHRYCSSRYTFSLREDIALGTIVRLHDNVYSGLDVNVLLVSKDLSGLSDLVTYTAVGISVFNLDRATYHRTTGKGFADPKAKTNRWITGTVLQGGPVTRGVSGNEGDFTYHRCWFWILKIFYSPDNRNPLKNNKNQNKRKKREKNTLNYLLLFRLFCFLNSNGRF